MTTDMMNFRDLVEKAPDADLLREMAGQMWQRIRETGDFNMLNSHYGMFRYAPVGPESALRG